MKRLNLFFTVFLIAILSYSQSISWGSESTAKKVTGYVQSLGWSGDHLYNIEVEGIGSLDFGGKLRLEKLSSSMRLMANKELNVGITALNTVDFILHENLIYVYTMQSKGLKEVLIYLDKFDLNGSHLGRTDVISMQRSDIRKIVLGTNIFSISPDKNKIAWSYLYKDKKANGYSLGFVSFNKEGKDAILYQKSIPIDQKMESANGIQTLIDNEGNIIFSYHVKCSKPIESFYRYTAFNKHGEIIIDKPLVFKDFFLGNTKIKLTENGMAFFTGMIGTESDGKKSYGGFFAAKLNPTSFDIETFKTFTYSEDFFKSIGYKIKRDGRVKFYGSYDIDIAINGTQGGFLIANHIGRNNYNHPYNKEIIIIPFDTELNMEDPKVVLRAINAPPPLKNGLGYFDIVQDGTLYLLYTDHKKNIERDNIEEIEWLDQPKDVKASLFIATIEPGKEVKRKILAEKNSIKGYLIPDKCESKDGRHIINLGNRSKVLYGEVKLR